MKYLTKKWYESLQKINMNLLIEIAKEAETFSEEYYKKVYQEEERRWIELQNTIKSINSKDVNKDKESFKHIQKKKKKKLENNVPDYILKKVADIRVLALGKASSIVKKELDKYCKKQKVIVEKAMKEYKRYNNNLRKYENTFIRNFDFHDCKIKSCEKQEKDLIITLDTTNNCLVDIKQIIFKNYDIIKEDNICQSVWLYNEVYIKDNGYEIHILLENIKGKLIDFIVGTDDVIYMKE